MNEETSGDERPLSLEKLVSIPLGQTEVKITTGLLGKVQFANLRQTVKFTVRELPYVEVHLKPVDQEFFCKVYVATSRSDWPDQQHLELYDKALYVAAKKRLLNEPDGDECSIVPRGKAGILKFDFLVLQPVSGSEVLVRVERKLDRVFDEMRRMLQVVSEGPNPDKYLQAALQKARAKLKNKE